MKELVLGINCFGHDSSAALVDMNGDILYCLTEERFSNKRHDSSFPSHSIHNLVKRIEDNKLGILSYIAVNHVPNYYITQKLFHYIDINFEKDAASAIKQAVINITPNTLVCSQGMYPLNYLTEFARRQGVIEEKIPDLIRHIGWCMNRRSFTEKLINNISTKFQDCKIFTVPHHQCHAASVFFTSGYSDAAIMTIDGYGEDETITLGVGRTNKLSVISRSVWPHSLGLLYSMVTSYLGFSWFGDEYKVMGMAAYGKPSYISLFEELGSVNMNGEFTFLPGRLLFTDETPGAPGEYWYSFTPLFDRLLGGSRQTQDEFLEHHFDIAASLQAFIEKCGVTMARYLRNKLPDVPALCIAGGVGLNGLMNERIYKEAGFEKVFIQPASSDDGTALGAALSVVADISKSLTPKPLANVFYGLDYPESSIEDSLSSMGMKYSRENNIAASVAKLLADGHVVARFEGRSEFGPRALGHRSIMASPLKREMKDIINYRIKHRERFRPFAPACLAEKVDDYFDTTADAEFMLLICNVKEQMRSRIPAVVHNDGTARVQSVHLEKNPSFYNIIKEFEKITGVPIIINTSFNINGEAIVETPQDALECFLYTDIDYLAIGDFLVPKDKNLVSTIRLPREEFLARRKQRYLEKAWSSELYWSSDTGSISAPPHELRALDNRHRWRRLSALILERALSMSLQSICLVGAGEVGMVMLNVLCPSLEINCLVDRDARRKTGFSKPVFTLEEAISQGYSNFIIASELYENELREQIMDLFTEQKPIILSFSDVII